MQVTFWRGPFKVVRESESRWKIISSSGTSERIGYRYKAEAEAVCATMNTAPKFYAALTGQRQ